MGDTGRYLYAICRGLDATAIPPVETLGGEPLTVVRFGNLSAVVSSVDLEEFGTEPLRANLEDLGWLERVARGHDAVVQVVAGLAPTAPLRLATICHDDVAVRRRLEEWHELLEQTLDRIEGRSEWSVKVFAADHDQQLTPSGAGRPTEGGAAYLRRKKEETRSRFADEAAANDAADRLHQMLSNVSVASRRLPPQDRRLTGHRGTMTLNGAYLVDRDRTDTFRRAVEESSNRHPELTVEHHGPWPPYSFATLEES